MPVANTRYLWAAHFVATYFEEEDFTAVLWHFLSNCGCMSLTNPAYLNSGGTTPR